MKTTMIPLVMLAGASLAGGAVIQFDLSPNAGALSSTNYAAGRDHAVGLSGLNEGTPNGSSASGGEIGTGIFYNTTDRRLNFAFAYGAAFGFSDLTGTYSASHIHGVTSGPNGLSNFPAVNTNAGVVFDLASFHTAGSGNSGSYSGFVTLSAEQETALLANRYYVNIHSSLFPGGEIRAQLIAVPEPSAALLALSAVGLGLRRRR